MYHNADYKPRKTQRNNSIQKNEKIFFQKYFCIVQKKCFQQEKMRAKKNWKPKKCVALKIFCRKIFL